MLKRRTFLAGALMFGTAGCGLPLVQQSTPRPEVTRSYDLQQFSFAAQADLAVSESESYYPAVDIVWRGDPTGPRIAQIGQMFEEAAARNRPALSGDVPVVVEITLVRFHGVTNRTRYSVGGVYNVAFDMTVRDANTGAILEPTRRVIGNLDAPGGERAVQLEESGQTEKVRVTNFLTGLLRAQLV